MKDPDRIDRLRYNSKWPRWLDDRGLAEIGSKTNWKQQYRLRHNWSNGQCAVSEIVVTERAPEPPLLVMLQHGVVFTADSMAGLRAWDSKREKEMIASIPLLDDVSDTPRLPTSMALDTQQDDSGSQELVVGYESGAFTVFRLIKESRQFVKLFHHPDSSNGMLSALAYSFPYILTMTEDHVLSLYIFRDSARSFERLPAPELLCSLRSHTAWPPVSLSLRPSSTSITAAIVYALPTLLSGWTIGIQEMRLSKDGEVLESRLASADDGQQQTLATHCSTSAPSTRSSSPLPRISQEFKLQSIPSQSKPTSMSYSHPYLLASHPDNTLTLYLVKSTSAALSISAGSRLWGHTSSVSGAHVGMRGKAVSVSRFGGELRVWDLEGGTPSNVAKRQSSNRSLSVRVQPANLEALSSGVSDYSPTPDSGLRFALDQCFDDHTISRGWVGFDDQNVVVLKEKSQGPQALVIYDFT